MIFISDFHCHLYGYDRGQGMKEVLCPAEEDPGRGSKEGESAEASFPADICVPALVLNCIREEELWEEGALFAEKLKVPDPYRDENTGLSGGVSLRGVSLRGVSLRGVSPDKSGGRSGEEEVKQEEGRPGCPGILTFAGIHPWDTAGAGEAALYRLEKGVKEGRFFVGEIGLDRLRGAGREKQLYIFEKSLQIALESGKPFTIHCVREWGLLLGVLEKAGGKIKAPFIVHAFGGSKETMRRITGLGGYISFGRVHGSGYGPEEEMFPGRGHGPDGRSASMNTPKAAECIAEIDSDRLLLETDFTYTGMSPAGKSPSSSGSESAPAGEVEGRRAPEENYKYKNPREIYLYELLSVYREAARIRGSDFNDFCRTVNRNGEVFKAYTADRQG